MWEIKIKPLQFYVDSEKPKIKTLRIVPFEHIPETGIKYTIYMMRDKNHSYEPDELCILDTKVYELTGSDYQNWANDLPYLENLILTFVGAEKE